jgi:predicted PurR-regulated permease PerM
LASKDSFKTQAKRFVKYATPKKSDFILHTLHVANVKFSAFIVGQVLEAIILGLLCAIGMLIFRFPYVAVISVLVGFTALIPVVGAYIGGIAGFLLICTISPIKALFFVLYLVVLQQIEGNVIYPKTVGSSIGLPGIFVFVSVVIGGGIGGIGGMLLGVPLMATVYTLISEKIEKNAAKAKSKNDTEEPTPTISEETNETEL